MSLIVHTVEDIVFSVITLGVVVGCLYLGYLVCKADGGVKNTIG